MGAVVVELLVVVVLLVAGRVLLILVHVMTQYEFHSYHGSQLRPTDGFQRLNSSGVASK